MNATNINTTELTEPNLMAENAIVTSTPATQATTANEAPINSKFQRWVDFVDQIKNGAGPVHQDDEVAQFIQYAEEIRKAKAERRLKAKLRKMEVEQKATLLAEAQKSIEEARRKFESQPQLPHDYTPRPPSSINDLFRAEKARDELLALEREQKEELLRQVMERRARELGDAWPRILEMSQDPRFDHIPKFWPGDKEAIAKAFPGAPTVKPKEAHE